MREVILSSYLFISAVVLCTYGSSEIRGLHPARLSLYSGQSFKCLDGSLTIPIKHINDDYCDCNDGTDEPGTSACPTGTFYCENKDYKSSTIPSSRVNDGICDCCDGSDEYSDRVQCSNICVEMGRQMREEEERQRLVVLQGHLLFKELVQQGAGAIAERRTRLAALEKEKQDAEVQKSELERLKNEIERPEIEAKDRHKAAWEAERERRKQDKKLADAKNAFSELDINKDGQVSVTEVQSHKEFDIDSNGEVSAEEAKEYLEDNDVVEELLFIEKIWENIHQIYISTSKPSEGEQQQQEKLLDKPLTTEERDEERYHDEEEDDDDDEDDDDNDKFTPPGEEKKTSDDDFPMPDYDEDTKKLIQAADDARQQYRTIEDKTRDIDNEINDLRRLFELDLGPEGEFYSLKGQCFDYTDREYTYSLCPFDRTSQRSKAGGGETSLGRWGEWTGPPENKYASMKYTGGQNCWNGPDRSAKIDIYCGLKNELIAASEPNRCEYLFVFNTPAACSHPPMEGTSTTTHPSSSPQPGHVEL